ncbi:MAG: putative O-sialoglycoprotein endopeptidase, partial [Actinomycetota bacterium]
SVVLPSREMCTDNAAMIASAAWYRLARGESSPLDTGANPNLKLGTGQR